MAPAELSVSPAGGAPPVSAQVYGGVPPAATKACEYAVPTAAPGSGADVVMARPVIAMVSCSVAVAETLSVTWIVKVYEPVLVGVAVTSFPLTVETGGGGLGGRAAEDGARECNAGRQRTRARGKSVGRRSPRGGQCLAVGRAHLSARQGGCGDGQPARDNQRELLAGLA